MSRNAANNDFACADSGEKQRDAIETLFAQLGKRWPIIIGGKKISDREYVPSVNPAMPSRVIESWARDDRRCGIYRYYAIEMRVLRRRTVTQAVPGERCVQRWTPHGPGVVIAPWNFPLAILTGLTVAPLVAGNTVIMKPAAQTSIIGAALMGILTEAGIPPGVVNSSVGHERPWSSAGSGQNRLSANASG